MPDLTTYKPGSYHDLEYEDKIPVWEPTKKDD